MGKKDKSSKSSSESIPAGDYEKGKKLFKYRCAQCHAIDSTKSMAGPTLHGIFGRKSGTAPGYVYSDSNRKLGVVWTRETLFDYLADPKKYIPGTKMFFVGIKSPEDRANLIKFMEEESAKPVFKQRCLQCHVIDSMATKTGPTLNGLIGRTSGSVPGFAYSDANKNK
ncbi:Mitochondrial cytochrome c, partial [Trichostrongylus colubriformis]